MNNGAPEEVGHRAERGAPAGQPLALAEMPRRPRTRASPTQSHALLTARSSSVRRDLPLLEIVRPCRPVG